MAQRFRASPLVDSASYSGGYVVLVYYLGRQTAVRFPLPEQGSPPPTAAERMSVLRQRIQVIKDVLDRGDTVVLDHGAVITIPRSDWVRWTNARKEIAAQPLIPGTATGEQTARNLAARTQFPLMICRSLLFPEPIDSTGAH